MAKDKFQKGDLVEVADNTSSHARQVGEVFTVSGKQNGYYGVAEFPNLWFPPRDLKHVLNSAEKLQAQLDDKLGEAELLRQKIAYLRETNQKTFRPKEFVSYQTLKVLEDTDASLMERAKAIARLYGDS